MNRRMQEENVFVNIFPTLQSHIEQNPQIALKRKFEILLPITRMDVEKEYNIFSYITHLKVY